MGRPKPHKSLPIPQITEKTLNFFSLSPLQPLSETVIPAFYQQKKDRQNGGLAVCCPLTW